MACTIYEAVGYEMQECADLLDFNQSFFFINGILVISGYPRAAGIASFAPLHTRYSDRHVLQTEFHSAV